MNTLDMAFHRLDVELVYMQDRLVKGEIEHHGVGVDSSGVFLCAELRQETVDVGFYVRELQQLLLPQPGKPQRIYIAGPYTGETPEDRDHNIQQAREAMGILARAGHYPFCPHQMSAYMDDTHPDIGYEYWAEAYLHWLKLCHGLLLLPGWQSSRGAIAERDAAEKWGIPVHHGYGAIAPVDGHDSAFVIANGGG